MLSLADLLDKVGEMGKKPGSVKYPQDKGDETFEELLGRHGESKDAEPAKDFKPLPPLKGYKPEKKKGLY